MNGEAGETAFSGSAAGGAESFEPAASAGTAGTGRTAGRNGAAVRRMGGAGLAAIGFGLAAFLATALLGPSAMQPALPGPAGRPPYSLVAHPSPYLVIGLVALGVLVGGAGLGLCLYAVRRGWRCSARRLLIAGLLVAAAFVLMPPVGSGDHLNYAVYGRMAVTGHDPYVTGARDLPGDPIAAVVEPPWREEPSIYGPLATAQEAFASWAGGDSVRLTVFVLSLTNALAFALVGLLLYRMARSGAGRLRSVLLWTGNPLLLFHLVSGAHNDVLAIAAAVGALAVFSGGERSASSMPRILSTGGLLGVGAAIKLPAALAGGGPAWALLGAVPAAWRSGLPGRPTGRTGRTGRFGGSERSRPSRRSWMGRLFSVISLIPLIPLVALGGAAAVVAVLAYVPAGAHAFDQVQRASRSVSLATPWHLVDVALGRDAHRPIIQIGSLVLLVVLGWLLLRLLPRGDDSHRIAAALVLAWLFAAPYALPWYDAFGWAMLALVPLSAVDALVLARTVALSLAYLPARDPQVVRLPDGLSWLFTVVRPTLIPWALTVILAVLVALAVIRRPRRAADRSAPVPVSPPRA
jgi:hypothetical protein